MPLLVAQEGVAHTIVAIKGKEETVKFLESLGLCKGGVVTIVSNNNGNMIIKIKESKIAINSDIASKVIV